MVSINKVQLMGNLTQDPEIKATANGRLARLSLATNRRFRDKDGEMQNAAQYHTVVVFQERLVDLVESYCTKGSQILVEGSLEHRTYNDQDGNKKYITEVVIRPYGGEIQLGNKAQGGDSDGAPRNNDRDDNRGNRGNNDYRNNDRGNSNNNNAGGNRGGSNSGGYDDLDDDIPF